MDVTNLGSTLPSNADVLRSLIRFVRALQFRRGYVVGAVLVATLLGGLYYSTATRVYQATASLHFRGDSLLFDN